MNSKSKNFIFAIPFMFGPKCPPGTVSRVDTVENFL